MKKVASIVLSALLFGVIAGASMAGINVAAQKAGITNQTVQESQALIESPKASTGTNGEAAGGASGKSGADSAAAGANSADSTTGSSATGSSANGSGTNSASGSSASGAATQTSSGNLGSVTAVAKECMPSVVAITNMMKYQQNGFSIFGNYQNYETEVPASGSGVIIGKNDTELLIVTNNHVVADSTSLSVTFDDDKTIDAEIKGTDASNDLAVVSVKLSDIPTETMNTIKIATLGNSDDLQVGDQVVAIGNALGYGQSVTTGIISAVNRDVETDEGTESGLLQTDAAINPGNSGGALLNMKGEVIGINVAKYSSTDVEGMGYSIPSAKAQTVINNLSSLETREKVPENERGYLGVQVKNIDANTAKSFDMPQGVFIYKFTEGSTAQNSGLQEKDIITALDGQGVKTYDDLATLLQKYKAGETVKVTVQRPNGSKYDEVTVDVVLGSADSSNQAAADKQNANSSGSSDNSGNANDPFQKHDNSGSGSDSGSGDNGSSNDNAGNGSGDAGNSGSGSDGQSGNGSQGGSDYDQEQLWKQFEEFFNQYNR